VAGNVNDAGQSPAWADARLRRSSRRAEEPSTPMRRLPLVGPAGGSARDSLAQRLARRARPASSGPAWIERLPDQSPGHSPQRSPERPALPLASRVVAPRVQRAIESSGAASGAPETQPAQSEQTAPARQLDVQALARKVYPILKRMLAVERERLRGF
jgi:hypothetical protein